jgi:hypothetical protein
MTLQRDKILHFIAGFIIGVFGGVFLAPSYGLMLAIFIGALKELFDSMGYGTPDVLDFFATVMGGVIGVAFLCVFI